MYPVNIARAQRNEAINRVHPAEDQENLEHLHVWGYNEERQDINSEDSSQVGIVPRVQPSLNLPGIEEQRNSVPENMPQPINDERVNPSHL